MQQHLVMAIDFFYIPFNWHSISVYTFIPTVLYRRFFAIHIKPHVNHQILIRRLYTRERLPLQFKFSKSRANNPRARPHALNDISLAIASDRLAF